MVLETNVLPTELYPFTLLYTQSDKPYFTSLYDLSSVSLLFTYTFKTAYCKHHIFIGLLLFLSLLTLPSWSNPRPISNGQLHTLLHFHLRPIYLVVFKGPYFFRMGYPVLRGASRLDAFSVYPFRTRLLCLALGSPADTPAVRPSRSSRTKDGSPQISCARAG